MSLQDRLLKAFGEFRTWRLQAGVACSQKSFAARKLVKKEHGWYFSTKAYNARVILAWLADLCARVAINAAPSSKIPLNAKAL